MKSEETLNTESQGFSKCYGQRLFPVSIVPAAAWATSSIREKRRLQSCYRIRVLLVSANKVRQRLFSMMRVVIHGVSPRQSNVFIMTCQCRNPMHVGVSSIIKEEGSVIIRWATSQQSEPKIITISKGIRVIRIAFNIEILKGRYKRKPIKPSNLKKKINEENSPFKFCLRRWCHSHEDSIRSTHQSGGSARDWNVFPNLPFHLLNISPQKTINKMHYKDGDSILGN